MLITLFKPGANGAIRYYTIHDRQPLLTASYSLTVSWRIGDGKEREKIYGFETLSEKDAKLRGIFSRKTRDGYRLLYSFMRDTKTATRVELTGSMEGSGQRDRAEPGEDAALRRIGAS